MDAYTVRLIPLLVFIWEPNAGAHSLAGHFHPGVTILIFLPYHTAVPGRTPRYYGFAMVIHRDLMDRSCPLRPDQVHEKCVAVAAVLQLLPVLHHTVCFQRLHQ